MARLGIGLIGVGKHGSRYARHIREDCAAQLRLVGVARRDAAQGREQAAGIGCRYYADYHELMAAPDVDAVVAVVPPTLHPDIVAAAAACRRPLLLEKPAAVSVAAGRRMLQAAQAAGIPVMVAQTLRYNATVSAVRAAEARLGRLHAIRLGQRFEPSRPGWIDDPAVAGGGIILHTGVHSFDLVRVLSGMEIERAGCEVSAVSTQRTEDNFVAALRLSGGAVLACVAGSRATASRSGGIELAGAEGQIVADHVLGVAHLVRGSVATPLPVPPPVPTVRAVLDAFAGALARGDAMPISLADGLRAVAVAEACYEAARTGRSAAVAPI